MCIRDRAEIEHLSTYYISHMMKSCLGLNFREFLSFSRVEFSEMMLLQTDEKIHTIAKRIGFSTTAYYEKFFLRWFGRLPAEHREHYACLLYTSFPVGSSAMTMAGFLTMALAIPTLWRSPPESISAYRLR